MGMSWNYALIVCGWILEHPGWYIVSVHLHQDRIGYIVQAAKGQGLPNITIADVVNEDYLHEQIIRLG